MTRVIQEHIKRPLAEELLFGRLANGGQVTVSVSEDGAGLKFDFQPNPETELASSSSSAE
jgi:ATP-dependent Clp protease ATP-binding subunit ClpA